MPEKATEHRCSESCPNPCYQEQPDSNELKYVTCCIRYMLDNFLRRGVRKREIITTLVGGANVLRNIDPKWSVAARNVAIAQSMLDHEGLAVAYADTGGIEGRVIEHLSDLNRTKVRYHGSEP